MKNAGGGLNGKLATCQWGLSDWGAAGGWYRSRIRGCVRGIEGEGWYREGVLRHKTGLVLSVTVTLTMSYCCETL